MSAKSTTTFFHLLNESDTTELDDEVRLEVENYLAWADDNQSQNDWSINWDKLPEWFGMSDWEYRQWEREHGI
jgi:hypothetical protein